MAVAAPKMAFSNRHRKLLEIELSPIGSTEVLFLIATEIRLPRTPIFTNAPPEFKGSLRESRGWPGDSMGRPMWKFEAPSSIVKT